MSRPLARSMVMLLAVLASTPALAGDAAAGQANYAVCTACHGANGEGNAALKAPAIAGQEAWYLVRQLQGFRGGIRGADAAKDPTGAQMAPMSKTLPDDKAVEDVAAYVGSLTPVHPPGTLEGDATRGATLYAVCTACHGADGKGNEALGAPSLLIQQDWYLVTQLANFRAGVRGTHPADTMGATMKPMADALPDEQAMKDVVAHILTLR